LKRNTSKAVRQHSNFVEMARSQGCDESEETFNAALRKVGRAVSDGVSDRYEDMPLELKATARANPHELAKVTKKSPC
jgi:hypothetical protein